MPDRTSADLTLPAWPWHRRRRWRALALCAALALGLHAAFLDGVGFRRGGTAEPSAGAMSVRTLASDAEAEPAADAAAPPAPIASPEPAARPRPPRRLREPAGADAAAAIASAPMEASGGSAHTQVAALQAPSGTSTVLTPEMSAAEVAPAAASAVPDPGDVAAAAENATPTAGAAPALLGAGESPPPLYRTQLPPSATLHYEVRRGFLRGAGEIRWEASGDSYRLVLEARIAGVLLLRQTSEGGIDANGLAPVRFLDQRVRRSAQAANFVRDEGRISFSGTGVEWPLLDGSQDRLSWMIQLAGIAAAAPELLTDGGRIVIAVIGARGDASVWSLRYAGREQIETANGLVHAIKLVREGRSAYDTSAEIWLDPERSYLPAHATLRNSSGASEYDLLLGRIDPHP